MTIRNKDRLLRKLAALPTAVKGKLRAALAKSADEMVALAKSLVPVDRGDLRDSIGWTWGKAPSGSMVLATGGTSEFTITIYAGNDEAFYARWVEFGTINQAAHPFFFPSYRALRKRARSRIARETNKAMKQVANG